MENSHCSSGFSILGWGSQHWQWQRMYLPQKYPSRKKGNQGSKRVKVIVYIPHVFCGYVNLEIWDGKDTTSEYTKHIVVIHSFLPSFWENGVFPNISVNNDATIISDSSLPNVNSWTLSVLRKEKNICMIWQPSGYSQALQWPLRNSGCEKCRILAQDSWDAYKRNDFSEPRLLYLPIHRKVLNSLTWDIWFSLIHRKTFDVETTCPLLRKFYITWLFPCYLLRVFSRGYLRCCLPELRLKNFHWINYNSQLVVCGYF